MKEKLGATNALYPLVTAIVGATVDGTPDFATTPTSASLTSRASLSAWATST